MPILVPAYAIMINYAFGKHLEEKHVTWSRFGKKLDKNATFQADDFTKNGPDAVTIFPDIVTKIAREVSDIVLAITSSYELRFGRFKRTHDRDKKIYELVKRKVGVLLCEWQKSDPDPKVVHIAAPALGHSSPAQYVFLVELAGDLYLSTNLVSRANVIENKVETLTITTFLFPSKKVLCAAISSGMDVQAFYAKESLIPPPDPITPPAILTPSPILPPSLLPVPFDEINFDFIKFNTISYEGTTVLCFPALLPLALGVYVLVVFTAKEVWVRGIDNSKSERHHVIDASMGNSSTFSEQLESIRPVLVGKFRFVGLNIMEHIPIEIMKEPTTVETDMVKLMVEIECFGKEFDEFDKETGSSDGLQPKQTGLSCIHALNELHLHEIHVVPSKNEVDLQLANSGWIHEIANLGYAEELLIRTFNMAYRTSMDMPMQYGVSLGLGYDILTTCTDLAVKKSIVCITLKKPRVELRTSIP
ncbi:hypothetical protein Tco_1457121 [Tanacetum coccineum]